MKHLSTSRLTGRRATSRLLVAALLGAHSLGCSVATEEAGIDESVRSEQQAVLGVDTHLYLRCGATDWNLGEDSRLKATSVSGVFELEAHVEQQWQVDGVDYCQMVETNEFNGWGTSQTGHSSGSTLEYGSSVAIEANSGVVSVDYPELGTFRFRFDASTSELSLADDEPPPPRDQTARMTALLSGAGGTTGFYAKEVGGPVIGSLLEEQTYDPASSIKIVVVMGIMQLVDDGAVSLDDTTSFFPQGLSGSCPTSTGVQESRTLGELIQLTITNSDNVATRSLIDFLGGFAAINQVAASLGMTNTNMNVYPGCHITNTMTQLDAARVYEGIADGTHLSPASRDALYARMPSSTFDFTGTLARAHAIIDELASAHGLSASQIQEFKDTLELHYKAGGDTWCAPTCLDYISISGVADVPTCDGATRSVKEIVWGIFIHGAPQSTAGSTFVAAQAEPLREPMDEALAGWAACSTP